MITLSTKVERGEFEGASLKPIDLRSKSEGTLLRLIKYKTKKSRPTYGKRRSNVVELE